jgi:hypothetical protein
MESEPLLELLREAAAGRFPRADGQTSVVPAPRGRCDAVLGFTAHHVVAAQVSPEEVRDRLPTGDIGAAMDVRFLAWLAERLQAEPGMLDAVLVADGVPGPPRVELEPLDDSNHPRVERSARYRTDVRAFGDPQGRAVVSIGRGLAGRLEVSIEIDAAAHGGGLGRTVAQAARTLVPPGELLFAQVTPGNARSLRAFLAAGYRPIGSEVLFLRPSP